jgi:Flp pilus assembly pilin Flp
VFGERPPAYHEPDDKKIHFRGKEKIPMKEKDPMLKAFLKDEQGQDLIEYTLLVAFVCLATAALFVNSGGSLSGIWISANSQLGAANTSAS